MTERIRRIALWAAVFGGAVTTAGAGAASDPWQLLTATGLVDARERAKVDAGDAVFVVLPARGRDLAVVGLTRTAANGARLAAWGRAVRELYEGPYVPAIGRFSDPPQLADVAGLVLDEEDLRDLRQCRPTDCAVKLSASEMEEIRAAAAGAGADWKPAVQHAFRQVVVARARDYMRGGLDAAPAYDDRKTPVWPTAEFDAIASQIGLEALCGPRVVPYFQAFPHGEAGGIESFLYWSKETLGAGKPIVAITHAAIFRHPRPELGGTIVAGRQVFATHYLTASLSLMVTLGGTEATPSYLVYLRRSRTDAFEGTFGRIVRHIVERRIRSDAPALLDALRRKIEGGEPLDGDPTS